MHDQTHLSGPARLLVVLGLLLPGLAGCNRKPAPKKKQPPRGSPPALRSIGEKSVKKVIRRYQGKVLLMNFWATWCGPCVDELPGLMKLARRFRRQGLVVATVSMDERDDEAKVKAFVRKHGILAPTFLARYQHHAKFANQIDPSWPGGLPATFIWDRRGRLRVRHMGELTYRQLQARVLPLLREN